MDHRPLFLVIHAKCIEDRDGAGPPGHRPVQLAWILFDEQRNELASDCGVIHTHESTRAPEPATKVTRDEVLKRIGKAARRATCLIGHHLETQLALLESEFARSNPLACLQKICTGRAGAGLCRTSRPPDLARLYATLFSEPFDDHDPLSYVRATARCFWKLTGRGIIKVDEKKVENPPALSPEPLQPPTEEQKEALSRIRTFLTGESPCFILQGSAGTGKTYLIRYLAERLKKSRFTVILLAPTGRAARVIHRRTGFSASTIHSHIYAPPSVQMENAGADSAFTLYFPLRKNDDPPGTLYVVDESSLVSDHLPGDDDTFLRFGSGRLLSDLLAYASVGDPERHSKLIFIGDPAQLPPVGSPISPALSESYLKDHFGIRPASFELQTVLRQKQESGILEVATTIRKAIRSGRFNELDVRSAQGDIRDVDARKVFRAYAYAFRHAGGDESILITRSNREALSLNTGVRQQLFPEHRTLTRGDRLIVVQNAPHYDLLNGDFVECAGLSELVEMRRPFKDVSLSFRDVTLQAEDGRGKKTIEGKILDHLLANEERNLTAKEQQGLIVDFRKRYPRLKPKTLEFDEAFRQDPYVNALRVKFGYAITCHKAQGGEWDTVLVNFDGRDRGWDNEDYYRWTYTAITRASRQLYVFNAPHHTFMEGVKTPPPEPQPTPDGNPKTAAIEAKIRELLEPVDAVLESLLRMSYRYRLIITCRRVYYRFDLVFNGKDVITSVQALPTSGSDATISARIHDALSPLARQKVESSRTPGDLSKPVFTPGQEHLEKLYKKLTGRLKHLGVEILSIDHAEWRERYTFRREAEEVQIDFCYNAKGRFVKVLPVGKSPGPLAQLILNNLHPS